VRGERRGEERGGAAGPAVWIGPWRRGPKEREEGGDDGGRLERGRGRGDGLGLGGQWCYIREREESLGRWAVLGRWWARSFLCREPIIQALGKESIFIKLNIKNSKKM
jgi:hypothetical protein